MLKPIDVKSYQANPSALIGDQWMLITAGNKEKCNTMTAAWGGLGVLWAKPVATIHVRPQRYTFEFTEQEDYFTLTFFDQSYKDKLMLCGRQSGRDMDKIKECGFTVNYGTGDAPYFEEAQLVLVCKKIYRQRMEPECFLSEDIAKYYPDEDYHWTYVGEIVEAFAQESI